MKIGLLTRNAEAWCSAQLGAAIVKAGFEPVCFSFEDFTSRVMGRPHVSIRGGFDLQNLEALIVRPIGRGSLDEVIFRIDTLHRLHRDGLLIINPPSAIERSVDKFFTLSLLEEYGIRVPRTIVTESPEAALEAFEELGGDVVLKPVFGSRGMGITRVSDYEIARRIFQTLNYHHHVLYVQEFIPHGRRDIRAFVVGDEVVAAMYRKAAGWKTNVSQGAKPAAFNPSSDIVETTLKAAKAIGCRVAGVDIIKGSDGLIVNEINSQPGFRGLQSVVKVNIAERIVEYVARSLRRGEDSNAAAKDAPQSVRL